VQAWKKGRYKLFDWLLRLLIKLSLFINIINLIGYYLLSFSIIFFIVCFCDTRNVKDKQFHSKHLHIFLQDQQCQSCLTVSLYSSLQFTIFKLIVALPCNINRLHERQRDSKRVYMRGNKLGSFLVCILCFQLLLKQIFFLHPTYQEMNITLDSLDCIQWV